MKKIDRAMQLARLLRGRRQPLPLLSIQEQLGCSERTALRLLAELRDTLRMPVEYDRRQRGWKFDHAGDSHDLPGLWFTPAELYAFMVSQKLLTELQPGVFDEHLRPIRERIETLLKQASGGCPELARRVRILPVAARAIDANHFRVVASALLERKQLSVLYRGRSRNETTQRTLSPQRLVYYRSNWYLDAWCHLRKNLRPPWMAEVRKTQEQYFRRSFSLDRLHPTAVIDEPARDIPDAQLDRHFSAAYGIFAGQPKATAKLRFSPTAARWVADEQWHPQQQGNVLPDGSFELRIPYSDPRELAQEILRFGPEVKVISPNSLRTHIANLAERTAGLYRGER